MSVPTTRTHERKPAFFEVPSVNAPEALFTELARCGGGREAEALNELYPKLRQVSLADRLKNAALGEIIIPQEYIVVGEMDEATNEGKNYDFLVPGQQFFLHDPANPGHPLHVRVEKNRRCDLSARALILLVEINNLSLTALTDVEDEIDVTTDMIGNNIVGQIHPGKSNGAGSELGYPNAYGHSRPVLPNSFQSLFASFRMDPVVALPPDEQPTIASGQKGHSLWDWLLLLFYKFIAWLLSAFGFGTKKPPHNQKQIKVAILDTGLDGEPTPQSGSCDMVHTGWNFVNGALGTPDVRDDHHDHHGTRIAAIIRQQAPSVICLPVKTANKNGVCELYDVLCGLEYARVNGASVVNASFSFSSNVVPEQAIPLLSNLISVLEKAGIWVIAAAGNAVQYAHDKAGDTPPLGQGAAFLYPACYSRASNLTDATDRIITVTTVSKSHPAGMALTFGLGECYSPEFVDVGMIANGQLPTATFENDKNFKAPGFMAEPGTSYATAYMTGRVTNALTTQTFAGKTQLVTAIGPDLKPELATGIQGGRSIPA